MFVRKKMDKGQWMREIKGWGRGEGKAKPKKRKRLLKTVRSGQFSSQRK